MPRGALLLLVALGSCAGESARPAGVGRSRASVVLSPELGIDGFVTTANPGRDQAVASDGAGYLVAEENRAYDFMACQRFQIA